ncbi:transposase, partial [Paraburkholderia sp. BR10954]|uniref:transposase n=1 Tax=Paraburkholderia sp. BR10954 TaxID=3236995 RepID=UPI0034D18E06
MNTIEEAAAPGRRRRRRYSVEFKAQVVAACQRPGVSLAAIALHHKLNANLLRRWVEQAETNDCVLVARSDMAAPLVATPAPEFVPLPLETRNADFGERDRRFRERDRFGGVGALRGVDCSFPCQFWSSSGSRTL